MKHTIYFDSIEEMNAYFDGPVPNNYVAIVGGVVISDDLTVSNALFSSTNNIPGSGSGEPIGTDSIQKVEVLYEDNTYISGELEELQSAYNTLSYSYTALSYSYTALYEDYQAGTSLSYDVLTTSPVV